MRITSASECVTCSSTRSRRKAPSRFEFPFACKEWVRPRDRHFRISNEHPFGFRAWSTDRAVAPPPSLPPSLSHRSADREKCVLPSSFLPSFRKAAAAALVNQPEVLITAEGERGNGRAGESGKCFAVCLLQVLSERGEREAALALLCHRSLDWSSSALV